MTDLQFAPALPWPAIIAGSVCLLAPCLLAFQRRARGALTRLAGMLLLILILCGPQLLRSTVKPLPDIAIVLMDQSQSMALGARQAMALRALAALKASAGETLLNIVNIQAASAGGTSIAPALAQSLAAMNTGQLAGIIAITDGEVTDADQLPHAAPITALLTASQEESDRELRLLSAPSYGIVGQTLSLDVEILDHGVTGPAAAATISVAEDGTKIAEQMVPIGSPVTLPLPVRHDGPAMIDIAVNQLPGEVSLLNNQAAFTLNGIHKRLNVLLISGAPDQGERAWRLLLKSDPAVQLVHFTILRDPGQPLDAAPQDVALIPFPIRELFETDLSKFNLIILDAFNPDGLLPNDYLQNIANFVQAGGALLTETGPEFNSTESLAFSPLASVIPAMPSFSGPLNQNFSPSITALGARHPVTAPFAESRLAPWYQIEPATQTAGDVLMAGPGNLPLLILAKAGGGRTAILLSNQLWLWTRGGTHSGPALPLLRRIVHWLLREPALEPESLAASISDQHLQITRRTLAPAYPGDATLTSPAGVAQQVTLHAAGAGEFTASLNVSGSGVWKVTEGNLSAYVANSDPNAEEYQNLAATSAKFRGVAQNMIWLGRNPSPRLGPLLTHRHAEQIIGTRGVPLFPPLPSLALALLLIAASWWREGGR